MASVEEQVEDFFKKQLSEFGIEYQTKTESINRSIAVSVKQVATFFDSFLRKNFKY